MTEEPAPRGRVDKAKAWYAGQPKKKRYGIGCCGCLGVGFILMMIFGLILTALGVTPDDDESTDATGEQGEQEESLPEDDDADEELLREAERQPHAASLGEEGIGPSDDPEEGP